MNITIQIPDYKEGDPISCIWEYGFVIKTSVEPNEITISANKAGLLSLANHFVNLAQDRFPAGWHMHFDAGNDLEDGSVGLIIEKIDA